MQLRFVPLLITLFLINTSVAEVIHIPDDYESIQIAIRNANTNDGDIILIEPGVYVDTIDFRGKDITVASRYFDTGDEDYIARTIIDGNDDHRVVVFQNDETENAKLIGLTIRNGRAQYGGGIYLRGGSTPILSHLIIYGNVANNNGGGIYVTVDSAPIIDRVTLYGNQANSYGAIRCYNGGTAVITNSIIFGNSPLELSEEMDASYCDIEDGREGEGNIDVNPLFTDADGGDFSLDQNSECIDAGQENATHDPDESRADMGALSFNHVPVIAVNPVEIDFGSLRLNSTLDRNVTIMNDGATPLRVSSIGILDQDTPFTVVDNGEAIELAPNEDVIVVVRFSPDEQGLFTDTLLIASNDPENEDIFVELTGRGTPPSPEFEIDVRNVVYGDVVIRREVDRVVTIRNSGNAVLNIESAAILEDPTFFNLNFNNAVAIQPDGQLALTVSFNPLELDDQSATLQFISDDEDEGVINVALSGTGVLPQRRYNFTDNTGLDHSMLVLSIDIDGEPLVFGSEVAIFTDDDRCCGADYWLDQRLGLAAWGDNEMTEAVDGWREGQAFSFKVWDLAADQEVIPDVEIVDGEDHFRPNGLTILRLNVERAPDGFKIYISNSWGIVSAPVVPEETNVVRLWRPIVDRGHLVIMKDSGGRFYSALFGFSNMAPWDFRQGYQVRGNAVDSLDLGGDYVAVNTPIPLRVGWNIVSYFPESPLTVQVAFRNVVNQINLVKDSFGRFYLPGINFSNMPPLRRGLGYQVRATQAVDLVWNVPQQQIGSVQPGSNVTEHFTAPNSTGLSMSILLNGGASLQGCEIAAYCPDGRLVGATKLTGQSPWGLALWGDDPTTTEKDGATDGEAIRFVAFDGRSELPVDATWKEPNIFVGDDFASVELAAPSGLPLTLRLESAQPNPFNGRTTLAFTLPLSADAKLAIYDLSGRQISLLAKRKFSQGTHRLVWDADRLSSGIYIARLETSGQTLSTKLTLLR